METRHISIFIKRPFNEVYDYVSNPENLPQWATGLSGSIGQVNGEWIAESPMGKVKIRFADVNQYGVVDHEVVLESGVSFYNPMRVLRNEKGSEVLFTLFKQPDVTLEKFELDASWVRKDLEKLKFILESVPQTFPKLESFLSS